MKPSLLQSVLSATREAQLAARSRLDRFLDARDPAEALVIWLDLRPAGDLPSAARLVRRLGVDIALIDELLSKQVDAILHHPTFQRLEASWRGVRQLADGAVGVEEVEIRLLDATWAELAKDQARAIEFDQSQLFEKVYSDEFGSPGGKPFGILLGDYSVAHRPTSEVRVDSLSTLRALSQLAAAAFAPFVAGADPALFGLDRLGELERPIDLERVFRQEEYTPWRALRESEDARFVGLVLPRVLMRPPYRDVPSRLDGFRYEENTSATDGSAFLWGNAVYAFAGVLIRSFAESGWLANIRGVERDQEGGGLATDLVTDEFQTDAPGTVTKCPTEVVITDAQERVLGELGFIPLCHCHGTPFAAFYGNQSIQSPKAYSDVTAGVNAKLSAMLQYILCVSRFAHYVKVIARNHVGAFANADALERLLNDWLGQYTMASDDSDTGLQARYPLREAQVRIRELPGRPGVFHAWIHLRPHFQLDDLTSSLRFQTELLSTNEL